MYAKRVLIIKTGHTEFLTDEIAGGPSLGDVFRATCILFEFLDCHVTWLTAESAIPLLPGPPFIDKVLSYSPEALELLNQTHFDLVINLERLPEICQWVDDLQGRTGTEFLHRLKPFGATITSPFSPFHESVLLLNNGTFHSTNHPTVVNALVVLPPFNTDLAATEQLKLHQPYQYYLFQAIGRPWKGQHYALPRGVDPEKSPQYQVGFNYAVGVKWPVKAWPMYSWEILAGLCKQRGMSYSFQEGFENIEEYMAWIQDHQLIVSTDSLGLHLALAMKRNVIGLFGPTRASDIYFYGLGEAITAETACPKVPCFQSECDFHTHCLKTISPEFLFGRVQAYLNKRAQEQAQNSDPQRAFGRRS